MKLRPNESTQESWCDRSMDRPSDFLGEIFVPLISSCKHLLASTSEAKTTHLKTTLLYAYSVIHTLCHLSIDAPWDHSPSQAMITKDLQSDVASRLICCGWIHSMFLWVLGLAFHFQRKFSFSSRISWWAHGDRREETVCILQHNRKERGAANQSCQ